MDGVVPEGLVARFLVGSSVSCAGATFPLPIASPPQYLRGQARGGLDCTDGDVGFALIIAERGGGDVDVGIM